MEKIRNIPKKKSWSNYAKKSLENLNFAKISNTEMKQIINDSYISIKIRALAKFSHIVDFFQNC